MDYSSRKEISSEYKWNLKSYYSSYKKWEKDYKYVKENIPRISKYQGKLLKSESTLKELLDTYYELETIVTKLYIYANLRHDEDLSNSESAKYYNKACAIYSEFTNVSSYIRPEILNGSKELLDKFLKNPILKEYKNLLNHIIRYKKHTLSEKEELIVSKLTNNSETFENMSSILLESTIDYGKVSIDGKETTITNSNYRNILMDPNRQLREDTFTKYTNGLKKYNLVFGESLISKMSQNSSLASIYNYKNSLDMDLFEVEVSYKVVDNLFKVVNKRLNAYKKYLKIVKSSLGLEDLEYYDMFTELSSNKQSFSIENVEDIIKDYTKIYGEEYHDIVNQIFDKHWIDYGSYKRKMSGAYTTMSYGVNPIILTNFHGKFEDISIISHELGHAVNFYLSSKYNKPYDYNINMFLAEIASLTNEVLLSKYIIKNSKTKELKLCAIENLIRLIENNLFDACLEAEIENNIYEKLDNNEAIDTEYINELSYSIRKKYYQNELNKNDNIKYLWEKRIHYYEPFYLYKYATSICIAVNVANKIFSNDENYIKKYINFLKQGNKLNTKKLLNMIDINLDDEIVFTNTIDYFEELLENFKKVSEN